MDLLRLYLLFGLAAHKAIWEILKRSRVTESPSHKSLPLMTRLVKAFKIAVLLGVAAQCALPDIFPIATDDSGLRVTGAILYTGGLLIAISGRLQLGTNWLDIESAGVLDGQQVVSRGIYSFIRHPIYVGDLILLAGFELALNSYLVVLVALLVPVVLRQAIREEEVLLETLPGYDLYCSRTKRFIPFLA